jgi:hypothetical protein
MNAALALVIAAISAAVALSSAVLSKRTQIQVTNLQTEADKEQRQWQAESEAKRILDRYRGPLLDAAWQLGDRLDDIRNDNFGKYLAEGNPRRRDAKLTTLFRFAYYFGWREFVRTEVQLLPFDREEATQTVAYLLGDITWVLASDKLDYQHAWLWGDEQRGIGELMTEHEPSSTAIVRGHAAFHRDYDNIFKEWMESFSRDLLADEAVKSERLRLVQWALFGLVRQLDEKEAYETGWVDRTGREVQRSPQKSSKYEEQIRTHLGEVETAVTKRRDRSATIRGAPTANRSSLHPPVLS